MTQWTSDGIYMWWWEHGTFPNDILTNPNTCNYGKPYGAWPFGKWCTSNHFNNHTIIIDINLCGSWAGGNDWNQHCAQDTGYSNCNDYVRENPKDFTDAYFKIQTVTVFQRD